MDALPASRNYLLFIGINCDNLQIRWYNIWIHIIRTIIFTLIAMKICFEVYGIIFFDNVFIINTFLVGVYIVYLATRIQVYSKTKRIFVILRTVVHKLDKVAIRRIMSYDKRQSVITSAFIVLDVLLMSCYFVINGMRREAAVLATGFKNEMHPIIPTIWFLSAFWDVFVYTSLLQFYYSVLFITIQAAEQTRKEFTRAIVYGNPDYDHMKRSLERYNRMMVTINEDCGIMPLSLLTMGFIGFASGISFVVTCSSELEISPYLSMMTLGVLNFLFIKGFLQMIELGHRSRKAISKAWKIAEKSVANSNVLDSVSLNTMETKKALKFYLITESIVAAKAMDGIIIDRSLVLNFFNQLIPFTVMMFTTIKEFEKNWIH